MKPSSNSKMKERRLARQREQQRTQLIRISAIVGGVIGVLLLGYFVEILFVWVPVPV